jgi:hypothetical protein
MKSVNVVVAVLALAAALPAAAAQPATEQPSVAPPAPVEALPDDAPDAEPPAAEPPAAEPPAAEPPVADGRVTAEEAPAEGLMPVAAAAAIGGAAAGLTGVGGTALFVMTGGIAFITVMSARGGPLKNVTSAMYYAAPFVFGGLAIVSAVLAGGITWLLSDAGAGATTAAVVTATVGVVVGVPLAALGVIACSLLAIDIGFDLLPMSMAATGITGGLFVAAAVPVLAVAAGIAGLTAAAAYGGDVTEAFVTELTE